MLYERFFLDFLRFFAEWLEKRKTFWYTENKDHGGGGKKEKMMERAENVTGWENIPITDYFVRVKEPAGGVLNVSDLALGEEQMTVLKRTICVENKQKMPASDYEKFAFVCRHSGELSPLFPMKAFDYIVKKYSTGCSENNPAALWQNICRNFRENLPKYPDICRDNGVESFADDSGKLLTIRDNEYYFSSHILGLNNVVKQMISSAKSADTTLDLLDFVRELSGYMCVEKYNNMPIHLFLCGKDVVYERPDPYRVSLAYEKVKSKKPLTKEEQSIFLLGVLYAVLDDLRGRQVILHLTGVGDGRFAAELLSWLRARGLLPSAVCIAAESDCRVSEVVSLCDFGEVEHPVFAEVVLAPHDAPVEVEMRLARLLGSLPANRLFFGGVDTASPGFFAYHFCFRDILRKVVAALCKDATSAATVGAYVLSSPFSENGG